MGVVTRHCAVLIVMVSVVASATVSQAQGTLCLPVPHDWVTVSAYFDHDGFDWNCGDLTYPEHHGTDFALIHGFEAMDVGVPVFAAAAGEVTQAHDGEFDRCTTGDCVGGGGLGNFVVLTHPDGSQTWYGHMAQGSVAVQVGDLVGRGHTLGRVGSSGASSGPHLHFEVRVDGVIVEPYAGDCGRGESLWMEQGGYGALPPSVCSTDIGIQSVGVSGRIDTPAERYCEVENCSDIVTSGDSAGVVDAWVGETVVWQVTVISTGSEVIEGAELAVDVPDELVVVRVAVDGATVEGSDSVPLGDLAAGGVRTVGVVLMALEPGRAELKATLNGAGEPAVHGASLDVFDPQTFDFDDHAQGWVPCEGGGTLSIAEGAMILSDADLGACAVGPAVLVEVPRFLVATIRLRHDAGPLTGSFGWRTAQLPSFVDESTVPFTTRGDGEWEEITVLPDWSGQLLGVALRIDGASSLDVDEVRLTSQVDPDAIPDPEKADADGGCQTTSWWSRSVLPWRRR